MHLCKAIHAYPMRGERAVDIVLGALTRVEARCEVKLAGCSGERAGTERCYVLPMT